jgi:hypothetical protein
MPEIWNIIKSFRFYNAIAVLAVLEGLLILAGVLPPISSYSAGIVAFSLAQMAVVAYMGISLAKIGFKKVAVKGALAGLVMMAVVSVFSVIGYMYGIPVLGIPVQSAAYLPVALISMAIANALLFAAFAVVGALLVPKKTTKKK